MVDSSPSWLLPAARIRSTASPSSSATWIAVVALIRPERLALGAAMGLPAALSKARATGWAGMRMAMLSRPAVTSSEIGVSGRRFSTRVSGPGQKRVASSSARSSNTAWRSAWAMSGRWVISGLIAGRPLVAKTAATALPFVASAPRPKTVSVGNATSFPAAISAPARAIVSGVAGTILVTDRGRLCCIAI